MKKLSFMIKRERTEKSKYKHVTTGDYCTCAAYIAEAMCLRNAQYQGKSGLPYKFWSVKPWDWTFKRQLLLANKLIKEFGDVCVVKAINGPEFKYIFSLNNPKVKAILNKYKDFLDAAPITEQKLDVVVAEHVQSRKKTFGNKSTLNRLRELDGKKEE